MNDFPDSQCDFVVSPTATAIRLIGARLWRDESGFVFSVEMLLLGTVVVIGLIVGHTSIRDALNCELSDIGGALQDLNQSYIFSFENSDGDTIESSFVDSRDWCDMPGDPVGLADNCIAFDLDPTNEGDPLPDPWEPPLKEFEVSEVGDQNFTSVNTGFGGSVSGTIGDGTLDTTFTTTTDTGQILGTSGNTIRFRESPDSNGTFTTTFADPLANVEFWVGNLTNLFSVDNMLGNFTVTLSDGTVLNNAAFTVLPDVINPNSTYGEFTTWSSDRESLLVTTIGGNQYVTDPTLNGSGSQSAGRIVFTGAPPVPTSPTPVSSPPVGISSISFERFGGPNFFSATFGFSGQVIFCEDDAAVDPN